MLYINLIFFILNVWKSSKNIYALSFYVITFFLLYIRFLVQELSEDYTVGNPEWVFPGVTNEVINQYQIYFLLFQVIFFLMSFFLKKEKRATASNKKKPVKIFYFIVTISLVLSILKAYTYTIIVFTAGYIASVDYQPNILLSILTSTLVKPVVILCMFLFITEKKRLYLYIFLLHILLIALTWQRKELMSLLFLFMTFQIANKYSLNISSTILSNIPKLSIRIIILVGLAIALFSIREGSLNFGSSIFLDLFWGIGITTNSGLFIISSVNYISPFDSWAFINTYFYCGIGKLISDVCYTDQRLETPGFLLEKMSSLLSFEDTTLFGGLGGNLIGTIYNAANFSNESYVNIIIAFLIMIIYLSILIYLFSNIGLSVTGLLIISNLLFSSRYGFDSLIPPFNQLFISILIDNFYLKKRFLISSLKKK